MKNQSILNAQFILKSLLLLFAVLAIVSCKAPLNLEDETPPTAGLAVTINGELLEFETNVDYSAELGDEITLTATGQDTDGLMCTVIWSRDYKHTCRSSDGLSQNSQGGNVEPFCEAVEDPPDQVPKLLVDTQEFVVDSSVCNPGFQLTHKEACYFAFAQNYGSGPDTETTARSAEFCYVYDNSE